MLPEKGKCLKSPVSESTIGKNRSLMYGNHLPYSTKSSSLYLPLKTSLHRLAISLRESSSGKKNSRESNPSESLLIEPFSQK